MPFVLLNGACGIAVGLATEVPRHNLREVAAAAVAVMRNDEARRRVLARMPGPDFAGGGQIITTPEEMRRPMRAGAAA